MTRQTCIVAITLLLSAVQADAQEGAGHPWAVWRLNNGFARIVARFDSEAEAAAERDRRNADNTQPQESCYLARREKLDAGGSSAIATLKGRRGVGTLGSLSAAIEFRANDFVIKGKNLEGAGTWSQQKSGAVVMETPLAIFRGLIDGNRVYGYRVYKDGSEALTPWGFSLAFNVAARPKDGAAPGGHEDDEVQQIAASDIKAYSKEKSRAVVGLLPKEKEEGNIVTAVPGSNNRVWDGNTLAGLKDLAKGKKVTDDTVIDRVGSFIREQDAKKDATIKESSENLRVKLLDLGEDPKVVDTKVANQVRQEIKQYIEQATPAERQELFESYAEKGAPITHIWRPAELKRIQWYQIPAQQNIREVVRNYEPPPLAPTPTPPVVTPNPTVTPKGSSEPPPVVQRPTVMRDVDLVGQIAPRKRLWYSDVPDPRDKTFVPTPRPQGGTNPVFPRPQGGTKPVPPRSQGGTNPVAPQPRPAPFSVNRIGQTLQKQVQQTQRTYPAPVVRPREPVRAPIFQPKPRENKVNTKPGGVIITACAVIDGLKPTEVSGVAFNPSTGILKFSLRSGGALTCKLNADDFTVAVRCVFERDVDPSLSMSYGEKKGYKSVDYTGPLFKTRFGKLLYQTDEVLGAIIFNREGEHRPVAAGIIPHYEDLVGESSRTMTSGSRVFLRATDARFVIRKDRLICRDITTKVDVEGMRYAADYFQESLHRLARSMDENFPKLSDSFDDFREFRGLVQCVALAKWIKRNGVAFDWAALKSRSVAETDIPALVPAGEWSNLFNGRNLDGWRVNLTTGEMDWSVEDGALKLEPTGSKALEVLVSNYGKDYDMRYTVVTEGPVDFLLRKGGDADGASVTLDSRGRTHKIELFLADGAWTAVAPGFGKEGTITVPEPAEGQPRQPNIVGIRVPVGSKLTLYSASVRGR